MTSISGTGATTVVALLAAAAWTSSATATILDALQWQRRALVVFTPQLEDPRWTRLRFELNINGCGVHERDIAVVEVFGDDTARLDGAALAADQSIALRRRLGVPSDTFAVILVGKDGGQKLREHEVPGLEDIFARIDGMPMRQAEIRATGTPCEA